jgi:isoquinoline 1-oxidoreductase beta subunit
VRKSNRDRIAGALYGEVTLKDGRVEPSNLRNDRVLRMNQAIAIEVHIVQRSENPGGMGAPGASAVMPALTNAISAATGKRVRE